MSQPMIHLKLTSSQADHLLKLLIREWHEGTYYGNKQQHHARRDKLIQMLGGSKNGSKND